MKYAVINESNEVINIVSSEPEYASEQGWISISEDSPVSQGWKYENGEFIFPPRPIEVQWKAIIDLRDQLLTESDVYVLPDRWNAMTPEEQTTWSEYRQALRDIPQNYDNPENIVWPIYPIEPTRQVS